jgi:hypothetical protein
MYLYDNTLLKSFWDEKCFKQSLRDKARFIFNSLFPKMVLLWGNVEKYGSARQATVGNIVLSVLYS